MFCGKYPVSLLAEKSSVFCWNLYDVRAASLMGYNEVRLWIINQIRLFENIIEGYFRDENSLMIFFIFDSKRTKLKMTISGEKVVVEKN